MKKLLCAELYKLSREWLLLGILGVITALCIVFTGQAIYSAEMIQKYSIYDLNNQFGRNFQSLSGFLSWYEKYRVRAVIGNSMCPLWCSAVLAAFFIGREFDGRNVSAPLTRGHTRLSYFTAKWLIYYAACEALSLFSLLLTLMLFTPGWMNLMPVRELCLCFCLRIVADMGTLSLPFLFAYIGRDLVKTVSCSAAYAFILSFLSGNSTKDTIINRVLLRLPYGELQTIMKESILTADNLKVLLSLSLVLLAVATTVSYLIFRQLELK